MSWSGISADFFRVYWTWVCLYKGITWPEYIHINTILYRILILFTGDFTEPCVGGKTGTWKGGVLWIRWSNTSWSFTNKSSRLRCCPQRLQCHWMLDWHPLLSSLFLVIYIWDGMICGLEYHSIHLPSPKGSSRRGDTDFGGSSLAPQAMVFSNSASSRYNAMEEPALERPAFSGRSHYILF